MSSLTIPTHLLERLQRIAEREERSVEAVLTTLLAGYPDEPPLNDDPAAPPLGTLARMAYEAQRAGIATGNPDLVDQSRDLLRTEFADHLAQRMNADDDADAH